MVPRALSVFLLFGWSSLVGVDLANAQKPAEKAVAAVDGKELFLREWTANDPRSHGGDGLGPMFNAKSCKACHSQGGAGGGGSAEHDVELLTVVAQAPPLADAHTINVAERGKRKGQAAEPEKLSIIAKRYLAFAQRGELAKINPGFAAARSVVWHRFSTRDDYSRWCIERLGLPNVVSGALAAIGQKAPVVRIAMQNCVAPFPEEQAPKDPLPGGYVFQTSRRNTPALFGAGRLDAITDEVLSQTAATKHPSFPEISGRVSRLEGGRIGRFGWQGQTATLRDFVLTACAVEIGLDVPSRPQPAPAWQPLQKTKGLDMNGRECEALISFVRELPVPSRVTCVGAADADVAHGERLFKKVGCAACHRPKLGDVEGVYSDLLLHDMGDRLVDAGTSYGGPSRVPGPGEPPGIAVNEPLPAPAKGNAPARTAAQTSSARAKADDGSLLGAGRNEWRTPPLWGVADSGPYMHDGRASSLLVAITTHDGEARRSAQRFAKLTQLEKDRVVVFLKSLVAPRP